MVFGHIIGVVIFIQYLSLFFPKYYSLLRLCLSWYLPTITHKLCPYRFLKSDDVGHLPRGPSRLYEMRLVMEVWIMKIEEIPELNE